MRQTIAADLREVDAWLDDRRSAHGFLVKRIPFRNLEGWEFHAGTGDLTHQSGRFFTISGFRGSLAGSDEPAWHQPIINQREIGILGILTRRIDGVSHLLLQAKMEPGNPNLLQLSPTVQATRSNYTRVHGGAPVRYLEYFTGDRPGRVVTDVLQSEHGDWFFQKQNLNMVVEVDEPPPAHPDFRWVSLPEVYALLGRPNLINMDTRSVLACGFGPDSGTTDPSPFARAIRAGRAADAPAVLDCGELRGWLTAQRCRRELVTARLPLSELPGWRRDRWQVSRPEGGPFRVVAVRVQAGSREVVTWTQPLVEPATSGLVAFLVRPLNGVLHVLVHARVEWGARDGVELGPTVQWPDPDDRPPPPLLDYVRAAGPDQVRFDTRLTEEGGRFRNAGSRYLIVEADDRVPVAPPDGYAWATVGQLTDLLRHSNYLTVQARTLLACLNSLG